MWSELCREVGDFCDLLFPPSCHLCGSDLYGASSRDFCEGCRAGFVPIASPRCPVCALPFATLGGEDHLCGACLRQAPPFDWTIAAGLYEESLRLAIHRFKFDHVITLDRPLAMMINVIWEQSGVPWEPQLLIPVPLHKRRLQMRTYNQSLLIAQELGRMRGIPVAGRLLERRLETHPQPGLSIAERQANLDGAFALQRPLNGERVLLVDDVMTTGATARACAAVLKRGGALQVAVVVLARARRNPPEPIGSLTLPQDQ